MLFEPAYQYDIIKDEEFSSKIVEITDILNQYVNRGYFTSFDDKKMYYEFFKVTNPAASIIIVHGYTEFTKKYYELTWYFMKMGYNVFLYDVRGHGYSHRHNDDLELTHVDRYEDYVSDLDSYIKQIVIPNSEGKPLYLFGQSMGGTIAQMYIAGGENTIQKTVLSAPMIYPYTPPLPKFVIKKLLANEARKFGWDGRFKFSSDFNPEIKIEKSNDLSLARFQYNLQTRIKDLKYRNSYGSNRWTYEAVSAIEKILNKKAAKKVQSKVFIVIAGQDTAVNPKHQIKLARLLNCEYKIFEKSKHSLYTMPDCELQRYVDALLKFYAE
ncbi:MAG: alpha/beta hydrolase [Clostridia bacterium]|nr:alpha/beta hydrolase [Clostridia bacterium]